MRAEILQKRYLTAVAEREEAQVAINEFMQKPLELRTKDDKIICTVDLSDLSIKFSDRVKREDALRLAEFLKTYYSS